jgi:hypothetical protein
LGLIGLLILALVIILVVRLFLILVPAVLAAIVVWFVTENSWLVGVALLVIVALSILKRL